MGKATGLLHFGPFLSPVIAGLSVVLTPHIMENFSELNLSDPIAKAIAEMGYTKPTPVQAAVLPILLGPATDLLGMAATGTGKTAAYGLPLLERIDVTKRVTQGVVLCPTRELAIQVAEHINLMGKHKKVTALAIYGGAGYMEQLHGLKRGAYIIVATPGRLIDHIKRGTVKLDSVTHMIFDEADEMISMGFKDALEFILQQISTETCRRWMFSATMDTDLRRVADTYLRDAKTVQINRTEMLSGTVSQVYFTVEERNKAKGICRIIDMADDFYGLIFCQTKALVTDLTDYMKMRGYKVDCLHGDKNQREREYTLNLFKKKAVNILICSDVAARGLDVKDISHVINYSIPFEFDSYVHRIGRTGRSGKAGLAMSLIGYGQRHLISRIEAKTKTKMVQGRFPDQKEICAKKVAALLPKFNKSARHEKAALIIGDEWKAALETMTKEEIAARFIAQGNPEWFDDFDRDDLNAQPERDARGHGGRRPEASRRFGQFSSARPERFGRDGDRPNGGFRDEGDERPNMPPPDFQPEGPRQGGEGFRRGGFKHGGPPSGGGGFRRNNGDDRGFRPGGAGGFRRDSNEGGGDRGFRPGGQGGFRRDNAGGEGGPEGGRPPFKKFRAGGEFRTGSSQFGGGERSGGGFRPSAGAPKRGGFKPSGGGKKVFINTPKPPRAEKPASA